jgi:hypothetical protein
MISESSCIPTAIRDVAEEMKETASPPGYRGDRRINAEERKRRSRREACEHPPSRGTTRLSSARRAGFSCAGR